jgi:hypothetical protein
MDKQFPDVQFPGTIVAPGKTDLAEPTATFVQR